MTMLAARPARTVTKLARQVQSRREEASRPVSHCLSTLLPSRCESLLQHDAAQQTIGVVPPRFCSVRSFASSSHDDFSPKRKAVSGEEEAMNLIKQHVQDNKVMLYMKGNPSMPMCGFSARVVQILKAEGVDFASVNVLDYPSIREGVKKFSDWPTIPQLYVNGEFIGGCDIVTSMHEAGELKDLLDNTDKKE